VPAVKHWSQALDSKGLGSKGLRIGLGSKALVKEWGVKDCDLDWGINDWAVQV
jgi:hypothetical protein